LIDTKEKLDGYLPVVRAADWIAVDTEADSLHAYPEKVCLIQISTVAGDRLVDPLAGFDIDPLLDALNAHVLIMHGADYDLRLLRKHHEFVPSAIFDTMLAARLLGERQFGLQALVLKHLGVTLEKGSQKANWARRPLTPRMEQYARNDTRYLQPLAEKLKVELRQAGRLAWHEESCARLIDECTQVVPVDAENVWRIRGSHVLNRAGLAVLRAIWHWREQEARQSNRPPFFILNHDVMVELAAAAAARESVDSLVPRHLTDRRKHGLSEAIQHGLAQPGEKFPEIPRRPSRRPSEAERRRYLELARRRDQRAHQLNIDPTLIASRATLGDLARNWDAHVNELMSWQRELLAA
jgi:ribonuclease D